MRLFGAAGARVRQAKLIFNPHAGPGGKPRASLEEVLRELGALGVHADVCAVERGGSVSDDVRQALERGFRLFVVCGGDGTISAAAGALADTGATLALVPTGSQNNMAMSLGIPSGAREALALMRYGRRARVDVGAAICGGVRSLFLETCSVGLVSALSAPGEAIQRGDLSGVGEFLGRLVSAEPAEMELLLDGKKTVRGRGHIALAANMPVIGFHYRCGPQRCCADGKLDLIFFKGMSKLDLLAFAARGMRIGQPDDERVLRFSARSVEIRTSPAMPVMADGRALGNCPVKIEAMKGALAVFAPRGWPRA